MANVTQLKHLEHIEDEILNHGSAGCMASVSAMKELLRMLGKKPSSGYMQTKWMVHHQLYVVHTLQMVYFL